MNNSIEEANSFKPRQLPYDVKISFTTLIDYWKQLSLSDNPYESTRAKGVLESIAHAKELFEPFEDISLIEKYKDEITLLSTPLFPELLQENEIKALTIPFHKVFVVTTSRLDGIMTRADGDATGTIDEVTDDEMYLMSSIYLLNKIYNAGIHFNKPLYFGMTDKETGLKKKFRTFFNADFVKITPKDSAPKLTKEDIVELVDNFDNIDLWKEKLPPNSYTSEGFGLISLFDITSEYALNSIKQTLLQRDVLEGEYYLDVIENDLKAFFNIPDIQANIAVIDTDSGKVISLSQKEWMCPDGEYGVKSPLQAEECFCTDSMEKVFTHNEMVVSSDLSSVPENDSPLFRRMKAAGVQSFMIHPIEGDERIKGFIEITSKKKHAINSATGKKLEEIVPMLGVAFKRAVEDHQGQIDSIIQEEFTSLHPSVSWKFQEVAEQLHKSRNFGGGDVQSDVVFNDVIPLYGQFDVRGSSAARNTAIQADLIRQLEAAEKVCDVATREMKLPFHDQLKFRIQKWRSELEGGIGAGDEVKILELLNAEVYPVFNHLSNQNETCRKAVEEYQAMLDPELKVIYDKRKKYEDSITRINEIIQDVIDGQQDKAQDMFPHYFEKYKTDGIEYNMYIGQTIAPRLDYDPMYLKNLKLWQLMLSHAVEYKLYQTRDDLPMPLDVVSLVLSHDTPMSIKFRMDEMKFDVDGAYNVRYEIVKKRIDKAHIKGTTERLTQPGTLSVVYSNDAEAREYEKYFEYLSDLGMFTGPVEHYTLEDLQGVSGLRALRIAINYDNGTDLLEKKVEYRSRVVPQ